MRKLLLALFTLVFVLVGGAAAQSALAQPLATPVEFPVTGTFSPAPGEIGVGFQGTVSAHNFTVQDGQLAVQGAVTATDDSLFSPFAVTIPAYAAASNEAQSGCTVVITTSGAFINAGFLVYIEGGAQVTLSQTSNPESARELCRVVATATRNPADQQGIARTLNRVLGAI